MRGDIALAGLVFTAEEWEALDTAQRIQLLSASRPDLVIRFFVPASENGQSGLERSGNPGA